MRKRKASLNLNLNVLKIFPLYKTVILTLLLLLIATIVIFNINLFKKVDKLSYNNRYLFTIVKRYIGKADKSFNFELSKKFAAEREVQFLSTIFVKQILDKYSIPYWVDWGTLLGFIRDGEIIQWDGDVDLGILDINGNCNKIKELTKQYVKQLEIPYNIDIDFYCYAPIKKGLENKALSKQRNNRYIDFFLHKNKLLSKKVIRDTEIVSLKETSIEELLKDNNMIFAGAKWMLGSGSSRRSSHEARDILPLKSIKINGYNFSIPNDYDKYLTKLYSDYYSYPDDLGMVKQDVGSKNGYSKRTLSSLNEKVKDIKAYNKKLAEILKKDEIKIG